METSYYNHEEKIEFNFWPAFTDLMLTLVLILVAIIYVYITYLNLQTVNLNQIRLSQDQITKDIKETTGLKMTRLEENKFRIGDSILIVNDLQTQRISFSDKVLFPADHYNLNKGGREMLRKVGEVIAEKLHLIMEIQIHGHADPWKTKTHGSNLRLAAFRAISVFDFLRDTVGIRPEENLMSATTFGEFKPTSRSNSDENYNHERLAEDNYTSKQRDENRRIELLLFYKK